jgi:hypothetical protein
VPFCYWRLAVVHLFEPDVVFFWGGAWSQDYKQKYPDVIVLDPPEAIQQLRNRQSMLQDVAQLNLCDCGGLSFLFSHSINVELIFSDQFHFWFLHLGESQI